MLVTAWNAETKRKGLDGENAAQFASRVQTRYMTNVGVSKRTALSVGEKMKALKLSYKFVSDFNKGTVQGSTGKEEWHTYTKKQRSEMKDEFESKWPKFSEITFAVYDAMNNLFEDDHSVNPVFNLNAGLGTDPSVGQGTSAIGDPDTAPSDPHVTAKNIKSKTRYVRLSSENGRYHLNFFNRRKLDEMVHIGNDCCSDLTKNDANCCLPHPMQVPNSVIWYAMCSKV